MIKVVLAICLLAAGASWALADDPPLVNKNTITKIAVSGIVKSVSWADPVKGTKSEVVVVDAKRKATNVLVTSTTTLWDAEDKAIMNDKIVPKCKVNVIYFVTPEGINEGLSIKILKKGTL